MSGFTIGGTPQVEIDGTSVRRLFAERLSKRPEWQRSSAFCPIVEMPYTEGTYLQDETYRGIDLQAHPDIATPVPLDSTSPGRLQYEFSTGTYRAQKYSFPGVDISPLRARQLADQGVDDLEGWLSDLIIDKVIALHYYHAITAIGASANYASGYTYDPGDFTTTSTDLIGLVETLIGKLSDSDSWGEGTSVTILSERAVTSAIRSLEQVTKSPRIVDGTPVIASRSQVAEFFDDEFDGGTSFFNIRPRHKNSSGTLTNGFEAKMAFLVPPSGTNKRAFATVVPQASMPGTEGVPFVDFRVIPLPELATGAVRIKADVYYEIHVERHAPNGSGGMGTDAGVLWTGCLS